MGVVYGVVFLRSDLWRIMSRSPLAPAPTSGPSHPRRSRFSAAGATVSRDWAGLCEGV